MQRLKSFLRKGSGLMLAVSVAGCAVSVTVPPEVADAILKFKSSTQVTVGDVQTSIDDALDTARLTDLVAFDFDSLAADIGGGFAEGGSFTGNGAAPAPYAPLAASDTCSEDPNWQIPADNICSVGTPDGALTLVFYVVDPTVPTIKVIDVSGVLPAGPDTPKVTISVEDLEGETGTASADIFNHKIQLTRFAEFTGREIVSNREDIVVALGGCPDGERNKDPNSPFTACNDGSDADDLFYSFTSVKTFSDGRKVTEFGEPSEPVTAAVGDAVAAGTFTKTVEFPAADPVSSETTTITFDRDAPSLHIENTRTLRDGRVVVEVGDIAPGTGDLTFTRDVTYEDAHPRKSLHEAGTIKGDGTGGQFDRTIVRDDGNTVTETAAVTIAGETTTITYDRNDGKQGVVKVTNQNGGSRVIDANVTEADGSNLQILAVEQPDGSMEANFWADRADIDGVEDLDADREGEQDAVATLSRDTAGAITGEGQFYDAGGNLHDVTFTITPGQESQVLDGGIAARRKIARDFREGRLADRILR